MTSLYGPALASEVTRAEVCLLFAARTTRTGHAEETILVSDRVILSPFAAKRLFILLGEVLARYELLLTKDASDVRAFMESRN